MLAVALVLAALAAVLHVVIFLLEAVLFRRPDVHARFRTRAEDVAAVRPWALNQGFYNLFLAVVAAVGIALAAAGPGTRTTGLALVLAACGSMVAAALVLVATDRRMARAAATQGVVPALAVVAAVVALV
jgi:putative membrane protein